MDKIFIFFYSIILANSAWAKADLELIYSDMPQSLQDIAFGEALLNFGKTRDFVTSIESTMDLLNTQYGRQWLSILGDVNRFEQDNFELNSIMVIKCTKNNETISLAKISNQKNEVN